MRLCLAFIQCLLYIATIIVNSQSQGDNRINTFRKLSKYIKSKYIKKYKRELMLGIAALIITDLLGLFTPWLIKCAIDSLKSIKTSEILVKYASLIVGVVIVQAVFRFYWRKYIFGFSRKVEYDLRNDYFRHLQQLSASFFIRTKIGDLMSRATNDLNEVKEFLGLGSMITVDSIVTISTSLTMMCVINLRLTGIAFFPMLIIFFLVAKFGKLIRKRYTSVQAQLAKISVMVQENISGIRVVQAYVQENNEKKRFNELNKEYIDKNLQLAKVSGVLFPLLTFMAGISVAIVLWIGGKDVITGRMTLGSFVAFNGYLAMLNWPMMAIGFMLNLLQRGAASMTRIDEVLNTKPEIYSFHPGGNDLSINNIPKNWDIEFNDVNFSYPEGTVNALSGINLKITEGSTIGIVGPVGSGKSTLGRLISRTYDVHGNQITIGGIGLKMIPVSTLRDNISVVDQDPFLFSGTIRGNIAFGDNNSDLLKRGHDMDNRIWNAAVTAGLQRDLNSFSDSIDTRIGERGVTLSGGQKQRVAIARALLRKSKILILDDAFSSLDTKTEDEILNKIKDLIDKTTTIIISHRISTIKNADITIVLNDGKIAEIGTHRELIDSDGLYCATYKHQILEMDDIY